MTKTTKCVSVWLDDTSDADEPKWIVDTDTVEGGESDTIGCYDDEHAAIEAAKKAARKRGLPLYRVDEHGKRESMDW